MKTLALKCKTNYFSSANIAFQYINETLNYQGELKSFYIASTIINCNIENVNEYEFVFRQIYDEYLNGKSDYLYIEDIRLLPFIVLLRDKLKINDLSILIVCHSIHLEKWYKTWEMLPRFLCKNDWVWITSEFSLKHLTQINNGYSRFNVIPLSVSIPLLEHSISIEDKEDYIIYIGRIIPEKGITELIKAWSNFKNSGYKLILVGKSEQKYHNKLDLIIRDNSLSGCVEFLEEIFEVDKFSLISNAKFLINPSYALSETFGLSIVEALCLGTPVICSSWSAFKEHISNNVNGIIFEYLENDIYIGNIIQGITEALNSDYVRLRENAVISSIKYHPKNIYFLLKSTVHEFNV